MLDCPDRLNVSEGNENRILSYDELFLGFHFEDADESIKPYIKLLQSGNFDDVNLENNIVPLKKFVNYLLLNEKYVNLFKLSMERYKINGNGDSKEIYNEVYQTTLKELRNMLIRINDGNDAQLNRIKEIIKILRGDSFVFKVDNSAGFALFEKKYITGKLFKKITGHKMDGLGENPVLGFEMHVGENLDIYKSKNLILKKFKNFIENVDVNAAPYVFMESWLLDTDFLRYRLKFRNKERTDEDIEKLIQKLTNGLGEISLKTIKDDTKYEKTRNRIVSHLGEDEIDVVNSYEKEGHRLQKGQCLLILDTKKAEQEGTIKEELKRIGYRIKTMLLKSLRVS